MGKHSIGKVRAVRDAIDRLEWWVQLATDFYGSNSNQVFAFYWEGYVAFYREPIPANSQPGSGSNRLTLPTRWVNREESGRMSTPGQACFGFAADVPREAFDRIEQFRGGGRLYARIEGTLGIVHRDGPSGGNGWISTVASLLSNAGNRMSADIRTEPFELTRDVWCEEVMPVLRPPGRFVMEVSVPIGSTSDAAGRRALAHIEEAQRAFDDGRWPEVARICYRGLEDLQQLVELTEQRYGTYAVARLREQAKTLRSLCDPERHAERNQHDGLAFDRVLAMHLLAATKSFAGVVLA